MHVKQTHVLLAAIVQIPLQKTMKQTQRYSRLPVPSVQRGIMMMVPNAKVRMCCKSELLVTKIPNLKNECCNSKMNPSSCLYSTQRLWYFSFTWDNVYMEYCYTFSGTVVSCAHAVYIFRVFSYYQLLHEIWICVSILLTIMVLSNCD